MPSDARSRYEVISDRDAALAYCAAKGVHVGDDSSIRGICQTRDGEVVGATLYQDYNGSNVWVHIAGQPGRRWLTRAYLHNIFKYAFCDLKVRRVSLWIEVNNFASRRFSEKLGFVHEATLTQAGRGGIDICVYVMFRESCRYA